jgi:hypothetical protein
VPSEECRSPGCRRGIDWAILWPEVIKNGRVTTHPVDHDSVDDPKGKLEVWSEPVIPVTGGDPVMVLRFRYLKKGEEVQPGRHRGRSHYATCTDSDYWRSQRTET